MRRLFLIIIIPLALGSFIPAAWASSSVGTVQSVPAYAWGENLGWITLTPDEGGLIIGDASITGYAWSGNYGWINFGPFTNSSGVTNNSEGILGGNAWVSGRGWLDMSGITIDAVGRFHGVAGQNGTPVGRVSFECDQCYIATDWRPASSRGATGGSGGGGSFIPPSPPPTSTAPSTVTPQASPETPPASGPGEDEEPSTPITPPASEPKPTTPTAAPSPSTPAQPSSQFPESKPNRTVKDKPLILKPGESGSLVREVESGSAEVDVFEGSAETELTVDIQPVPADLGSYDSIVHSIGDYFYDVTAVNVNGQPLSELLTAAKVTLPLPSHAETEDDFGVYRLEPQTGQWTLVSPAIVTDSSVTFYTNALGRFAILSAPGKPERISPSETPLAKALPFIIAAGAVGGAWFVVRKLKAK